MRIAFAASEAVPFCKTGGLADVTGSLSRELAGRDHQVSLFLPLYRQVRAAFGAPPSAARLALRIGGKEAVVELRRLEADSVVVYLVDYPPYFDRAQLYHEGGRDYPDNAERFALFCRAALEGARALGQAPDVFHCHDWQAGLIPAYLAAGVLGDGFSRGTATVFTIHNMAYQGLFPKEALEAAGLPAAELTPERLEYYGQVSYLKAGLVHAHVLSTVSPAYAREIRSSAEMGMGMEGVLRARSQDLFGILNGLDVESWDPRRDKSLPRGYGPKDFAQGKAAVKRALQKECGLRPDEDAALIGSVTRLDRQKGMDIALEVLPKALENGAQFALVGHGDPALERAFTEFSRRHPGRAYFCPAFNDALARRLYAACDFFLMPSRFEPCGLGQMIAMRYGSLPVVTRTGGLSDTVFESGPGANGFLAERPEAGEVSRALGRALASYRVEPEWSRRARTAMNTDFSWARAVESYEQLYRKALDKVQARGKG